MKNDSAQAVGGLVLVDGDIGEQLVDVLPGPLVGTLVLGNIQRRIHKQFIDTDDLAGQFSGLRQVNRFRAQIGHSGRVLPVRSSCIMACSGERVVGGRLGCRAQ
ncbi:hypothetical protein D3C81_1933970 [compost metagenome]